VLGQPDAVFVLESAGATAVQSLFFACTSCTLMLGADWQLIENKKGKLWPAPCFVAGESLKGD